MSDCLPAIIALEQQGFRPYMDWAYSQIGFGFGMLGSPENGLEWIEKAIEGTKQRNDIELLRRALNNKGCLLAMINEDEQAIKPFLHALDLTDPPIITREEASLLNNLAFSLIHFARQLDPGSEKRANLLQQALEHSQRALQILENSNLDRLTAWSLHNQGCALNMLGMNTTAKAVFEQALSFPDIPIRYQVEIMADFAWLACEMGDPQKAETLINLANEKAQAENQDALLDKIFEIRVRLAVFAGKVDETMLWSERRIRFIDDQNRKRLTNVLRNAGVFVTLENMRQAAEEARNEKNQLLQSDREIKAHLSELVGKQNQDAIKTQPLETARGERERFSRSLHDGLSQTLGVIQSQVSASQVLLKNGRIKEVLSNLQEMFEISHQAHSDMRNLMLDLRHAREVEESFRETLEKLIKRFSNTSGTPLHLILPEESLPELDLATKEHILSTIQEALANIHKHAQARHAKVIFNIDDYSLHLLILDDGIGFDPKQSLDETYHFGIKIMQERIRGIGGRFQLRSAPGAGTKIIVSIPIQRKKTKAIEISDSELLKIRLLLVDNSTIFLESLRNLLTIRGLTVCGIATNYAQALLLVRNLHPDLVVMDVFMPGANGIETLKEIKAEAPGIKVIILTSSEDDEHLTQSLKNGASGYLNKNLGANDFLVELRKTAMGDISMSPRTTSRVMAMMKNKLRQDDPAPSLPSFTRLQRQVLEMVEAGMKYKEIADQLRLSEGTIKYHVKQILIKLSLEKRSELEEYAQTHKL